MSATDILSKEKVYLNHLSTKCSFSGSYIFSFMFVSKHYWIYTFKKVSCFLLGYYIIWAWTPILLWKICCLIPRVFQGDRKQKWKMEILRLPEAAEWHCSSRRNCFLLLSFALKKKKFSYTIKIPRNKIKIGDVDPIWHVRLEENRFLCFSQF